MKRKGPQKRRWIRIAVEVCFERKQMTVLHRNGRRETRTIVTPRIRLPNGHEIRGARVSEIIAGYYERK